MSYNNQSYPQCYSNGQLYQGYSSHGYSQQQYPSHTQGYLSANSSYLSYPASAPMRHDPSQDSHYSSSSDNSSNNYASSYSTSPTTAYSPTEHSSFDYRSSASTSTTNNHHYAAIQPSHPIPQPPSTTKDRKQKSSKPTPYICLFPQCDRAFARSFDLNRHQQTHFPNPANRLDCPKGGDGGFCGRVGDRGFGRQDHLNEHLRKVHLVDIPKTARGSRP